MQKSLPELKQLIIEAETRKEHLVLEKLPYGRTDLEPVMSEATLDYHYGKLAKGYVDRYNKGEGDPAFNEAGAFLHNIFFPQLKAPSNGKPFDASAEFINKHFSNFDALKSEVEEVSMKTSAIRRLCGKLAAGEPVDGLSITTAPANGTP